MRVAKGISVKGSPFLPATLVFACLMAQAQSIHVVTETSYNTRVVDGKVVGPVVDVVEASLKHARVDAITVDAYPWARAYLLALREPNTVIFPIARTPERETQF